MPGIYDNIPSQRDKIEKSYATVSVIEGKHFQNIIPRHKIWLAQKLINDVIDNDEISAANFHGPDHHRKYINQARRALRGLSLA